MKLLAAPDKFRGSLTAAEVASAIADGAGRAGWTARCLPLADGGEGTLSILGGANRISVVTGPLGDPVEAAWRLDCGTAVVEAAAAAGLTLAGGREYNNPLRATTRGVGELIAAALEAGAEEVIVAVGGTATTDGGRGAIDALSHFLPLPAPVRVACDVETRFVDAADVFAPQKGAGPGEVRLLRARLVGLAREYSARFGVDVSGLPGSGAAGGLAGGLAAIGARLRRGFDLVADAVAFDDALTGADLVVTGEGSIDATSFSGKVVGEVAARATLRGVPLLAVAGDVSEGTRSNGIRIETLIETFGAELAWNSPGRCISDVVAAHLAARTFDPRCRLALDRTSVRSSKIGGREDQRNILTSRPEEGDDRVNARKLGTQGLVVSEQGLGCVGMTGFYGSADEREAIATIQRAVEIGITLLDTADWYGPYTNEQLVGRAIAGRRDEVTVATKFGHVRLPDGSRAVNGRPEYVRAACEGSLRRLGIETIDLYYLHRVDPGTPIEETVGAMAELIDAGKVRYLGLSEAAPATIRRAHGVHPISALQNEYSLWTRDPEGELLATLRELEIGLVAFAPLGRGILSGTIRSSDNFDDGDYRLTSPRFVGANLHRNLDLVAGVKAIADAKGITVGQLALAWVLSRGGDVVPIPGTKRVGHLEENAAASAIDLTPEEIARIETAFPRGAAAGNRYQDMSTVGR